MIDYQDNDHPHEPINIYIGKEEWTNYSFESKVRLLYRLRQASGIIPKALEEAISSLVQDEQDQREIDFDATFQKIYKEVDRWAD